MALNEPSRNTLSVQGVALSLVGGLGTVEVPCRRGTGGGSLPWRLGTGPKRTGISFQFTGRQEQRPPQDGERSQVVEMQMNTARPEKGVVPGPNSRGGEAVTLEGS